jgi:hypothetical protein
MRRATIRAVEPGEVQRPLADDGVGEIRATRRSVRVVEQRPCQLVRERRDRELLELTQLVLERRPLAVREEHVRDRVDVERRERAYLPFERGRQRPHRPDPRVLDGVVLRLDQHVEAEDRLAQRRQRDAHCAGGNVLEVEADGQSDCVLGETVAARS